MKTAIRTSDLHALGEIATRSCELSQAFNPHPHIPVLQAARRDRRARPRRDAFGNVCRLALRRKRSRYGRRGRLCTEATARTSNRIHSIHNGIGNVHASIRIVARRDAGRSAVSNRAFAAHGVVQGDENRACQLHHQHGTRPRRTAAGRNGRETSSGNFALGMAIVCNRLNHPFVAIGDPVIDPTFKRQLEMLGGRVEIVTDKRAARGTRRRDSIDCTKFSMPSKGRSGAASTTTRTTRSLTPTSPTSCWTGSAPPDSRRAGRLRRLELRHGDVAARGRRRLHARRRRHLQQRPVR